MGQRAHSRFAASPASLPYESCARRQPLPGSATTTAPGPITIWTGCSASTPTPLFRGRLTKRNAPMGHERTRSTLMPRLTVLRLALGTTALALSLVAAFAITGRLSHQHSPVAHAQA